MKNLIVLPSLSTVRMGIGTSETLMLTEECWSTSSNLLPNYLYTADYEVSKYNEYCLSK